jgi:hypothetical protein
MDIEKSLADKELAIKEGELKKVIDKVEKLEKEY